MMKRTLSTAMVLALVMMLSLAVTARAQGNGPGPHDGDCPLAAEGAGECAYGAPQDGSGQQLGQQNQRSASQRQMGQRSADQRQAGQAQGPNYQDDDGDQLCDHYATGASRQGNGTVGQSRYSHGQHAQSGMGSQMQRQRSESKGGQGPRGNR